MSETESAVTQDTGSATVDATSSQGTGAADSTATASDAGAVTPKSYTQEQVSEIVRKRLSEADRKWKSRESEWAAKEKDWSEKAERLDRGFEAFAKGLGLMPEQPKDPWKQDISSLEERVLQKISEREQAQQERVIYGQISGDWRSVEASIPEAKLPGFKEAWAAKWDPDQDPMIVAKNLAAEFEKYFAAKSNASVEAKEQKQKVAPVPPGRGTSSPSKSEEKIPLHKQIAQRVLEAREK